MQTLSLSAYETADETGYATSVTPGGSRAVSKHS